MFATVEIMHWLIPNVPKAVKDQIERENLIKQQAMWQINSLGNNKSKEELVKSMRTMTRNLVSTRRLFTESSYQEIDEDERDDDMKYDEDIKENDFAYDDNRDVI